MLHKPPGLFYGLIAPLAVTALLQGCSHAPVTTPQLNKQTAAFYWPYAALASNVYTTKGAIDVDTNAALASPFLRTEVRDARSEKLAMTFINLDRKALTERYKEQLRTECGDAALQSKDHATLLAAHCRTPQPSQGQADPRDPRDPEDDAPRKPIAWWTRQPAHAGRLQLRRHQGTQRARAYDQQRVRLAGSA